jgi:hypothetical protein
VKPEWGLSTYNITKAENGYIVWCSKEPVLNREYKMRVFSNLRTVFIWLCREFLHGDLMKELTTNK